MKNENWKQEIRRRGERILAEERIISALANAGSEGLTGKELQPVVDGNIRLKNKAVRKLKRQGEIVTSKPFKGRTHYCLANENDQESQ